MPSTDEPRDLRHHIHDPLRDDDHLLGRLALQRPLYLIECQNSSLDFRIAGAARRPSLRPFLAIDLHRQRDGVLDQQSGLDLGPAGLRDQAVL